MNIRRSQRFWKYYLKFKKVVRVIYDISSLIVLLMSFETAYRLKNWSVVKPWQIARLVEKFPRTWKSILSVVPSFA
jgi:hypothetical protein